MNPPSLSLRQRRALAALLSCNTIEDAAKFAGCSRSTLWRWRQSEQFSAAMDAAASELTRIMIEDRVQFVLHAARTIEEAGKRKREERRRVRAQEREKVSAGE